jgi:hypothetical protein
VTPPRTQAIKGFPVVPLGFVKSTARANEPAYEPVPRFKTERSKEPKENVLPELTVVEEAMLLNKSVASLPKFALELPLLAHVPGVKHPEVVNV